MIVSKQKVLSIVQNASANGMSNKEISEKIMAQNPQQDNLLSVKVMVSRKTKELIQEGYIRRSGRRFLITEKSLPSNSNGSGFLKRSYTMKNVTLEKLQASISVPTTSRGQSILEDPRIRKAIELIDNTLQTDDEITIIIKKEKNNS